MKDNLLRHWGLLIVRCAAGLLAALVLVSQALAAEVGNTFKETILVASNGRYQPTAFIDPHIENAWGMALRPPGAGGHIWISNARNASTSLYIGDVNGIPLHQDGLKILQMEGPLISYEGGLPQLTGQVYNAASDYPDQPFEFPVKGTASNWTSGKGVPIGVISGSAKFVFVTKDGTVNAWRANTAASMNTAVLALDYSDHGKDQIKSLKHLPAFTGVAMTTEKPALNPEGQLVADNRLYVTDFQNKIIRVIDNTWTDITERVPFQRPEGLKEEMSPYNIQYIEGKLYVTYAVVDPDAEEPAFDVPEEGGHVFVYDRDGHLLHGFDDEGKLQSPWGVAIAPAGFGKFGGKLLVASFGNGTIAGFDPESGKFVDFLRDDKGEPLALDGLWALGFGNGVSLGDAHALYYTAGPNKEQDGVFGRVNYLGDKGVEQVVAEAKTPAAEHAEVSAATRPKSIGREGRTVRDFGATGDGKTDDTAAIQRAVASGVGEFPEGTYRLTQTVKVDLTAVGALTINGERARIIMAGEGPAFRVAGNGLGAAAPLAVDDTAARERQCGPRIEGLRIVGDHALAEGIEAEGTTELTIRGVSIANVQRAVNLTERNADGLIADCRFGGSVILRGAADIRLRDTVIKGVSHGPAALTLDGSSRCVVQNCSVLDSDNIAIWLKGSEHCAITGCVVRDDRTGKERKLAVKVEGEQAHWFGGNWIDGKAEGIELPVSSGTTSAQ